MGRQDPSQERRPSHKYMVTYDTKGTLIRENKILVGLSSRRLYFFVAFFFF